MRVLIVFNPFARGVSIDRTRHHLLADRLQVNGIDAEVQPLDNSGSLGLDKGDCDLIVISGGDGTVHSLLHELVSAELPVAILPSGTANVLARELRIPGEVDKVVDLICRGKSRKLRLGLADGQYFHLVAGIGADSYVIKHVRASLKQRFGILAFWLAGMQRFWRVPLHRFDVTVEDDSHSATFAVISNSRFYGRHFRVTPEASVFEGALDLCLFTSEKHRRYLRYIWAALWGKHIAFSDVIYKKVTDVKVTSASRVPVQLDGELAGFLPRNFAVAPEGLDVIVP